ncbi:MAG: SDR family NAD(P)-dependent oxidoreductase [Thermodesulfobacteriota bacterium]|nr:SDR family NAD(P)-dependent oxidoreductase [Thermodesulfobacteriota bacterium]
MRVYCSGMIEKRWERIINLNSTIIHKPVSGSHAYAVAKAAMIDFTKNWRLSLSILDYSEYHIVWHDPHK